MPKDNKLEKLNDIRNEIAYLSKEVSEYNHFIANANMASKFRNEDFLQVPKKWTIRLEELRQEAIDVGKEFNNDKKKIKSAGKRREYKSTYKNTLDAVYTLSEKISKAEDAANRRFKELEDRVDRHDDIISDITKNTIPKLGKEIKSLTQKLEKKLGNEKELESKLIDKQLELDKANEKVKELTNENAKLKGIAKDWGHGYNFKGAPITDELLSTVSFEEALSEKLRTMNSIDRKIYDTFEKIAMSYYSSTVMSARSKIEELSKDLEANKKIRQAIQNAKLCKNGKYKIKLAPGCEGEIDKKQYNQLKSDFRRDIAKAETRQRHLYKTLRSSFLTDFLKVLDGLLNTKNTPDQLKSLGLEFAAERLGNQKYIFKGTDVNKNTATFNWGINSLYDNIRTILLSSQSLGIQSTENFKKSVYELSKSQYDTTFHRRKSKHLGEQLQIKVPISKYRGYGDLLYTLLTSPGARNMRGVEATVWPLLKNAIYWLMPGTSPSIRERFLNLVCRTYYINLKNLNLMDSIVIAQEGDDVILDAGAILGGLFGTIQQLLVSDTLDDSYKKAMRYVSSDSSRKIKKGISSVKWVLSQFTKGIATRRKWTQRGEDSLGREIWEDGKGTQYFVDAKRIKTIVKDGKAIYDMRNLDPDTLWFGEIPGTLPTHTQPNSNKNISNDELKAEFSAFYLLNKGLFVNEQTPKTVARMMNLITKEGLYINEDMARFLDSTKIISSEPGLGLLATEQTIVRDMLSGVGDTLTSSTKIFGSPFLSAKDKTINADAQNKDVISAMLSAVEGEKTRGKGSGGGGDDGDGGDTTTATAKNKLGSTHCCCCEQRKKYIIPILGELRHTANDISKSIGIANIKLNAMLRNKGIKVSTLDTGGMAVSSPNIGSTVPTNIESTIPKKDLGNASTSAAVASSKVDNTPKKATYQAKQETKDRKRAEQKSFIALLIPELAKLMKKGPIWDIFKLLFLQLGAKHPKTAAALLLGGPALAFGGARLAGRALLGLPGWAGGGTQVVAKAGAFGGPIQNTKGGWTAFADNTFSGNGVIANLKKAKEARRIESESKVLDLYIANKKYERVKTLEASVAKKYPWKGYYRTPAQQATKKQYFDWIVSQAKGKVVNGKSVYRSADRARYWKAAEVLSKNQIPPPNVAVARELGSSVSAKQMVKIKAIEGELKNINSFGNVAKSNSKAVWEGIKGNAAFNWAKYSEKGAKGTFGTLKNAAKGAPGVGALLEVLFDIPDIYKAAISGKKGELAQQLCQTLGGALGALLGFLFAGPIGAIIGPMIGRSIGKGFGKHTDELGKSLQQLGSAFAIFMEAIKPVTDVVIGALEKFGEALANGLVMLMDGLTKFLLFLASFNKDLKKDLEERGFYTKKYSEDLSNPNSSTYKKLYNEYEKSLRTGKYGGVDDEAKALATRNAFNEAYKAAKGQYFFQERTTKEQVKRALSATQSVQIGGQWFSMTPDEATFARKWLNSEATKMVGTEQKRAEDKAKEVVGSASGYSLGSATSLDGHAITSDFGYRIHPIFKTRKFHTGVDLNYSLNEPVKAKHGGKVISVGNHNDGYGNVVVIQEDNGYIQKYAHLNSTQKLKYGSVVNKGDTIGLAGSTGYSTGPHLHYEVMDKNKKFLNPVAYENGIITYASVDKTGNVVLGGGNTSNYTTPAQTNDGVRDSLLSLAGEVKKRHELEDANRLVFDPTDVTGSLGCWGVVGMNNTGVYK